MRQRLKAVHREWVSEWLPSRATALSELDLHISDRGGNGISDSQSIAYWAFTTKGPRSPTTTSSREAAIAAICAEMFGADSPYGSHGVNASVASVQGAERIVDQLSVKAWSDWQHRLATALGGVKLVQDAHTGSALQELDPRDRLSNAPSVPGTPNTHSCAWSGSLLLSWHWCGGNWNMQLPYDVIEALVGPARTARSTPAHRPTATKPIERIDRAMTDRHITLRALLRGTELTLGQLQDLRQGDVVPLIHKLDEPAWIIDSGGAPVCEGWLGQSESRIAVELVHLPATYAGTPATSQTSKERKS